mmetsp:Transcript_12114/g.9742  ORF Transcript_12114/g.9742 Transcript_12114/m.9742 type:complete len:128 (-) Transcript_12114:16-399(-)
MRGSMRSAQNSLDAVQTLPHHDAVAPDNDHADLVLLGRGDNLHRVVQDNVHELIIAAKYSDNVPVRRQLQVQALLHELPEVGPRSGLRHDWKLLPAQICDPMSAYGATIALVRELEPKWLRNSPFAT